MTSSGAPSRPSDADLDEVCDGLAKDLDALRSARIFLTGATGFFGRWWLEVFHHLYETRGFDLDVVGLARRPERLVHDAPHLLTRRGLAIQAGDVRDFGWPDGAFDLVVHGATSSDARAYAGDPLAMYDTIVGGTRRTLEFAAARGVQRFLFVSSGAVYGRQAPSQRRVPESSMGGPDPLDPASLYGESKRAAELLAALVGEATGLHVTSARCFAFVGPYLPLDWHFAVGNFVRDALAGGPIRVQGDGTPRRSYMYPTDLVRWLVAILLRGGRNRAYNVGSDDDVSVGELALEIGRLTGVDVAVARTPDASQPPARYVPDVTRARSELALELDVPRAEALARTLRFHGWRGAQ